MTQGKHNNKGQRLGTSSGFDDPMVQWLRRRSIWGVSLVVGAILAASLTVYFWPKGVDKATEAAQVNTLETSLAIAQSNTDDQGVVNITTQLVNGVKSGTFTIDTTELAKLYLDRATSEINLSQFQPAITDCEHAMSLDSNMKLEALQVDFQASYKIGLRQPLVPMLQQLITLEKNSGDPMSSGLVSQYQQDITEIQQGQEVTL